MNAGKSIEDIGNVERGIAEKYIRVSDMMVDVLDTMSENISPAYNVCVDTGIVTDDGEYYFCIENGAFCIMQDVSPGPEHEYLPINPYPYQIDNHDLVELVLRLPQVLEAMLEEMQEEKENCSEAETLLQKIREVIQE